jgi:glycosyltransferase involved in cell wall biosynthesis
MRNAALYMHVNAYDTGAARLLGRHSAGESFLRGYLRHADVDRFWLFNAVNSRVADLDALIARIEPPRWPTTWISADNRAALADVGVLHMPVPDLPAEAWLRWYVGVTRYAICGITHTTATQTVMRILTDFHAAPLDGFDALICTSSAVRASVETQLELMRDYMTEAFGPRRRAEPMRVTIPLGVNPDDFAPSPEHRRAWRERLQIGDDEVVVLYVGRFNARAKMNPALMAMALERAARRTGKPLHWVNSGWSETPADEALFHEETRKLCPSVSYHVVDGRRPDARFAIWSVADLFISLSDNIQETFGLTPVEAMAAGLPSVVSDWDGYKDTVRDGVDGFRVPTVAPRPGFGNDLAYLHSGGLLAYDNYVGAAAQYTAVDLGRTESALVSLIEDEDLRRRMGASARARAREVFDWAAIVPQYQALWAEQDARRRAAPADLTGHANPVRPDPYRLFAAYPSRLLSRGDVVHLVDRSPPGDVRARLARPLAGYSGVNRPTAGEIDVVLAALHERSPQAVAELLERVAAGRRPFVERGLIWLARHDVLALEPAT